MPWELPELLGPDLAREGLEQLDPINHIACTLAPDPVQPFARVATLEASLYMRNQLLRDTDWASMAHSLEVRVPLVDAELLRSVAPVMCSVAAELARSCWGQIYLPLCGSTVERGTRPASARQSARGWRIAPLS